MGGEGASGHKAHAAALLHLLGIAQFGAGFAGDDGLFAHGRGRRRGLCGHAHGICRAAEATGSGHGAGLEWRLALHDHLGLQDQVAGIGGDDAVGQAEIHDGGHGFLGWPLPADLIQECADLAGGPQPGHKVIPPGGGQLAVGKDVALVAAIDRPGQGDGDGAGGLGIVAAGQHHLLSGEKVGQGIGITVGHQDGVPG